MKKIMFNDRYGLTQAVLEGRKTQTRRIIPPSVAEKVYKPILMIPEDVIPKDMSIDEWVSEWIKQPNRPILVKGELPIVKDVDLRPSIIKLHSRYQVGEVVAVAQRYIDIPGAEMPFSQYEKGCRNKMFVRAEWMPHKIRITNVRMERLQNISDEEALKEGIVHSNCKIYDNGYAYDWAYDQDGDILATQWFKTPKAAFSFMIDKISGKGTWDKNPWVFAYDFELIK